MIAGCAALWNNLAATDEASLDDSLVCCHATEQLDHIAHLS